MFWNLISGVAVWTVYEVTLMWGFAHNYGFMIEWNDSLVAHHDTAANAVHSIMTGGSDMATRQAASPDMHSR